VAKSQALQKWASDVGLSKHVYLLGVADDGAEAGVTALNQTTHAGVSDWQLVKTQTVEAVDRAAAIQRLGRKIKIIEPAYYPRLKGADDIFKIKPDDVENHLLVQKAMAGEPGKVDRITAADIGAYMIKFAIG
jgi:hypothetical protein